MKHAAIAAATLLTGAASAQNTLFTAIITGDQEVPATNSPAIGAFNGTYNAATNTFSFSWEISNDLIGDPADPGAHIHNAPFGANGPIVFGFNQPDGTWPLGGEGVWTDVPSDMVDALNNNQLYVNFHTTAFPSGEVRGQIRRVPTPASAALIGLAGLLGVSRRR